MTTSERSLVELAHDAATTRNIVNTGNMAYLLALLREAADALAAAEKRADSNFESYERVKAKSSRATVRITALEGALRKLVDLRTRWSDAITGDEDEQAIGYELDGQMDEATDRARALLTEKVAEEVADDE